MPDSVNIARGTICKNLLYLQMRKASACATRPLVFNGTVKSQGKTVMSQVSYLQHYANRHAPACLAWRKPAWLREASASASVYPQFLHSSSQGARVQAE